MRTDTVFHDRLDAGRCVAAFLSRYANRPDTLVLALPRGGVPVGFEVAMALKAPLEVFVVRKIGVPGHEELAMGAVATGGVVVVNHEVVRDLGIPLDTFDQVAARERIELARREAAYRGEAPPPELRGRIVFLVDDGLATGSTMQAAVRAVRAQEPARLVVAVPVAAPQTCEMIGHEVDEIECALTPDPFHAVGAWYEDFSATSDDEVRDLLKRAHDLLGGGRTAA